jgi:hypothetical protein
VTLGESPRTKALLPTVESTPSSVSESTRWVVDVEGVDLGVDTSEMVSFKWDPRLR